MTDDIESALKAILLRPEMYGLGADFTAYEDLAISLSGGIGASRANRKFAYDQNRTITFSKDGQILDGYFKPEEMAWIEEQKLKTTKEVKNHALWLKIINYKI